MDNMPPFTGRYINCDFCSKPRFKNGDHPKDNCMSLMKPFEPDPVLRAILSEGKVVRYYRSPRADAHEFCQYCKHNPMHVHGWIDTLEGGHIVCPGDWVITGIKGESYPIKNDIFLETYESIAE